MKRYLVLVFYTAKPGMREAFVREVADAGILDEIRREDGAIRYEYYYSAENEDGILLPEEWAGEKAQQVHLQKPHMERLKEMKGRFIGQTQILFQGMVG